MAERRHPPWLSRVVEFFYAVFVSEKKSVGSARRNLIACTASPSGRVGGKLPQAKKGEKEEKAGEKKEKGAREKRK